jgi:hypothetical protein
LLCVHDARSAVSRATCPFCWRRWGLPPCLSRPAVKVAEEPVMQPWWDEQMPPVCNLIGQR